MRTYITATMMALLAYGCAPSPQNVRADRSDLRTRDGVCAASVLDVGPHVDGEACLRQGSPQTLHDKDEALLLVSMRATWLEGANTGSYQITVTRDGNQIYQSMMNDSVPSTPASPDGYWTGHDVIMIDGVQEWQDGVYEIEWVAGWDTTLRGKATIALGVELPEGANSSERGRR